MLYYSKINLVDYYFKFHKITRLLLCLQTDNNTRSNKIWKIIDIYGSVYLSPHQQYFNISLFEPISMSSILHSERTWFTNLNIFLFQSFRNSLKPLCTLYTFRQPRKANKNQYSVFIYVQYTLFDTIAFGRVVYSKNQSANRPLPNLPHTTLFIHKYYQATRCKLPSIKGSLIFWENLFLSLETEGRLFTNR